MKRWTLNQRKLAQDRLCDPLPICPNVVVLAIRLQNLVRKFPLLLFYTIFDLGTKLDDSLHEELAMIPAKESHSGKRIRGRQEAAEQDRSAFRAFIISSH
jgi:hypothetical protein